MKKTLLGILMCFAAGVASAAEQNVLQLFTCNLAQGKNYDNVFQTLEMLADRAQTGELELEARVVGRCHAIRAPATCGWTNEGAGPRAARTGPLVGSCGGANEAHGLEPAALDQGRKPISRPLERLKAAPPAAGSRNQAWKFQIEPAVRVTAL